ncbi:TVP38/TMEM64 family protein [Hyphomonas sp.]|uniref:TVP38/TMEM64 family protein n=1 Tax=Hyphomonas sp. TaxID=87 RepID=UPI000AD64403|nr:TVP38/TMEM64 family protein [Hyphomonas sp.]MBA4339388.1 TVP38/TMEM64 family protein [Hyphomonas sp.]
MTSKSTALWIRLWPVYVILLGLGLSLSQGWHEYLTLDALSANAVSLDAMVKENFLIVFAGYILIYAAATTFMVPGSALTIAGGFLFGLVIGTPATVIGATIGASILFFASKTSIGAVLRDVAGPFIEKMRAGFAENPVSYMFALRLIPIFPFAAVNIAPGLLGAKYRDYLLTTFFGIIPGTLAYTWIGAAVKGTLLEGGTPDIGSLAANFVPAFIALGLVSLLPVAYKKFFPRKVPA